MNLDQYLELFGDTMLFIFNKETKDIKYPDITTNKGREKIQFYYTLESKGDNILFNPYTRKIYEKEEKEVLIDNKKYQVIRLLDITKYKNLENDYILDETTGLYLRKKLLRTLNDYLKTSVYDEESFSLTMVDIDFFKRINDTYGHQFGDICLSQLATILHEKINCNKDKKGILGRFGGEEFIFTINNIDYDYAEERNEYIRKYIEKELEYVGDKKIDLTCSLGTVYVDNTEIRNINIESTPDIRSEVDLIIKSADKNLYESKRGGRNRLTLTRYKK